jgi:hypothetical protein
MADSTAKDLAIAACEFAFGVAVQKSFAVLDNVMVTAKTPKEKELAVNRFAEGVRISAETLAAAHKAVSKL